LVGNHFLHGGQAGLEILQKRSASVTGMAVNPHDAEARQRHREHSFFRRGHDSRDTGIWTYMLQLGAHGRAWFRKAALQVHSDAFEGWVRSPFPRSCS
jgi:hypothetical protein